MELELFHLSELHYFVGYLLEQLYKNAPTNLVEYFCFTPFVAILSLCTVLLFCLVEGISLWLW